MQISSNLLLAAQQQAARPAPPQAPAFAAALASEARKDALFAPLDFKQAAAPRPQPAQGQLPRPGATLDIRV